MLRTLVRVARRSSTWGSHLSRAYAEGNMTAGVRIDRATGATFDRTTGRSVPGTPELVYVGKARVAKVSGAVNYGLGDEPQYYDTTTISVPFDAPEPRIDDVVTVTAHDDPTLVDRAFRCTGLEDGGQMPDAQRMSVVGIAPSKQWSAP